MIADDYQGPSFPAFLIRSALLGIVLWIVLGFLAVKVGELIFSPKSAARDAGQTINTSTQ